MNPSRRTTLLLVALLTTAALPAAVRAGKKDDLPLYLWPYPSPFETIEAAGDEAYRPGELVAVAGRWRRGGLPGGAILVCTVSDPEPNKKNILAAAPFGVRYFYLDVLPPDAPAEEPGGYASARGLLADDDLYAYAYILRPQTLELREAPAFGEGEARAALASLRKRIKKIKLELISNEGHRAYDKKYKIVADGEAAEIGVEAVDYERGLAVVHARLERLPPLDSDVLFRYLDVYVVGDVETGEAKWALACLGGYYLE